MNSIYSRTHTDIYIYVCMLYIHTYIHTYIHIYIHTHIHTDIQTYIHTYRDIPTKLYIYI